MCLLLTETASIPRREIKCNGSVEGSRVAFGRASLSGRGSGILHQRRFQRGVRTRLVLEWMGDDECCWMCPLKKVVLVAWFFHRCSTVKRRLKASHGPFTVHGVVWHSTEHGCHVVVTSFSTAVSVSSRRRWKVTVLGLCLCLGHMEEATRLGFLLSVCFALFDPYQSKAVRWRFGLVDLR